MNFLPLITTTVLLSACAHTITAPESIVGTHKSEMGKPGDNIAMSLACERETDCTFTTIINGVAGPDSVVILKKVKPVADLIEAKYALNHAIEHQRKTPQTRDNTEAMNRLRSTLSTKPSVSRCWDLDYPEPSYMLVCTLSNTPAQSAPLFLFATLMENCRDVFCRYLILPMRDSK